MTRHAYFDWAPSAMSALPSSMLLLPPYASIAPRCCLVPSLENDSGAGITLTTPPRASEP